MKEERDEKSLEDEDVSYEFSSKGSESSVGHEDQAAEKSSQINYSLGLCNDIVSESESTSSRIQKGQLLKQDIECKSELGLSTRKLEPDIEMQDANICNQTQAIIRKQYSLK